MIRILFLVMFLLSFSASSQKKIEISLEGFINNFSSKEKLFGASLYLFQDGRMVSKSLSDVKGNYRKSFSVTTLFNPLTQMQIYLPGQNVYFFYFTRT